MLAQSLDFPMLYPAGLFVAPVFACYLLGLTRIPMLAKVLLIPAVFASIAFSYLPRSSCSEEDSPQVEEGVVHEGKTGEVSCNG